MRLTESRLPLLIIALLATCLPLRGGDQRPSLVGSSGKGKPIDIPVPVGEPVTGIKIPQYDEEGKLSMTLLAGTARKIDDRKVEFGQLKVTFTDKEGKETLVDIPHALLDTGNRMLTSDSKTVVTREDFDIEGEKAEFDTVERTGTFRGRVRASFRNAATAQLP